MKKSAFLLALTFVFNFSFGQVNLTNGLVGYFPLDNDVNDYSSASISGTNYGASSTTGYDGTANAAMQFISNENDYVEAGNDMRGITNQMSVSFWFRTSGFGSYWLVEKYNWTVEAGFYIYINNGAMGLHGRDGSGLGIAPSPVGLYNDGQWHHVVGIVDGNDWILYVDCEKIQHVTTTTSNPDISVDYPLTFGRHTYGTSNYFEGELDEVRLYNRVLNDEEVCFLCNTSSSTLGSNLIGYFPLNNDVNDYSPLAINGLNYGASSTTGHNGNTNSAMHFNASEFDYIEAGNDGRGYSNQMTVSFWFRTTATSSQWLVEKYNWTVEAGFYVYIDNGAMGLHGRDGSGIGIAPTPIGAYNDGEWHHVIGIVDNNDWILYVDCIKIQHVTTTTGNPSIYVDYPLTFGRHKLGDTHYFDGDLDEVRIYKRPLSSPEICVLCQDSTSTLRIDESVLSEEIISVYPNPTADRIYISGIDNSAGEYEVRIYNLMGQCILQDKLKPEFDISSYIDGVYILEIYDNSGIKISIHKIIKI